MKSKGLKSFQFFLVGAVISLYVVVFILFVFLLFVRFTKNDALANLDDVKISREYQSLEYDEETQEFTYGIVQTMDQLEPGEYLSEVDVNGNHFLISNFGDKEYLCSGTCICEEPLSEVRRNSMVFTRPAIYLVAAFTSYIALERAADYFREDCEEFYGETCHSHAIKSEVGECKEVQGEVDTKEEDEDYEDGSKAVMDEEGEKIKFMCTGSCGLEKLLYVRFLFEIDNWTKDERVKMMCLHQNILNFVPHDQVPFPIQMYNLWNENCIDIDIHGEIKVDVNSPDPEKEAKEQFENDILLPYCRRESNVESVEMTMKFMNENLPEYKKTHICELGETGCRKIT